MSSLQLQKLRISVKAYESAILDTSCNKIVDAVKASGIDPVGPIPLPTKLRRYCVLTSPHVNKASGRAQRLYFGPSAQKCELFLNFSMFTLLSK